MTNRSDRSHMRTRAGVWPDVPDLPAATDDLEIEPPDDLVCPITYSLFRDPVHCLSDGRVYMYEKSGIIGFWQRRPLADFLGGPRLDAARLRPALDERVRVRRAAPGELAWRRLPLPRTRRAKGSVRRCRRTGESFSINRY